MLNTTDADLLAEVGLGPTTRSALRKRKVDYITIQYEPERKFLTNVPFNIPDLIDEREQSCKTPAGRKLIDDYEAFKFKKAAHIKIRQEHEKKTEKTTPSSIPDSIDEEQKLEASAILSLVNDGKEFDLNKGKKRISKENRKNFDHIHAQVTKMREVKNAPIDIYKYCHRDIDPNLDPEDIKFHTIVELLISTQTKDQISYQVAKTFREQVGTMEKTLAMDEADLQAIIKPAGLSLNKTKFIRGVAKMVRDEFGGKMPTELNDVIKFPGVRYKIGILYLKKVEGKIEGIGVDSNVDRVVNRLGLVDTQNADQTRLDLESFVDRKYWEGLKQAICRIWTTDMSAEESKMQCLLVERSLSNSRYNVSESER